jgi:tetratricopeptide (TPR) repeat protein
MSAHTQPTQPLLPTGRPLQPGDVIGEGFVIERTLGGGGMGQVYLARDPRLDRLVAIKLLHAVQARTLENPMGRESPMGEEADARFRREARALSRIVHPNVVGIHTFGRADGGWFLVMEYVEGQSLDARLKAGPIPLREALAITRQVASGLQEAHALGIVHRDVKPGNVLLRALASGGQIAKVCDFGLARQFQGQETLVLTQEATILGTPSYMAPEQIQGQPVDGRTDLYALGVMLYQMLSGRLPFKRDSVQATLIAHLLDEPPPLADTVPDEVEREIRKALAKDPQERHASPMEFVDALDAAANVTARLQKERTTPCPSCDHGVPDGDGFCAKCGSPVPTATCASCGAKRDGERYRCVECGASLVPWTAQAGSVVSGMRTTTAAVLVARLECAESDVATQADFAAAFATAVAREGGRTAAFVGREAVALWGLGGMADDDVAAAVDAALALFATGGEGQKAIVRAAIDLGLVASRGVGVVWGTALAAGETVERARAAASKCAPGQVTIGEKALREVRGQFEVQGKRVVLRRRDASLALADYMARDVGRPMVGRDVELGLLLRAARKTKRDGGLVAAVVSGQAEVGKSRLCGELLRQLETTEGGWRMHVVRCGSGDAATSWLGLGDLVRAALPPVTSNMAVPDGDLMARLRQLPGLDDGDSVRQERRVTALARMLGLTTLGPGAQAEPASEAELQAAFEAWAALVRRLCQQQPTVWVIEGLDYARPSTLSLLGHIARNTEDVPLLMVLPLREDRRDVVLAALQLPPHRTQTVELEALDPADTRRLVEERLEGFDPPEPLLHALQKFSDGIPGRIEQALDTLTEEGTLTAGAHGWALQSVAQAAGLLERSMSELLLRRVSRLAPPERGVLDALALAGGPVPLALLAAMLGRDVAETDLLRLQQAGFLLVSRTQRFAGQREIALRLDSLAGLLRDGVPKPLRRDLHVRAAGWLKGWEGPPPPQFNALLAWHLQEAGETAEAAEQWLRNAEDAVQAFANRDAFEAFAAAVDLAGQWQAVHSDWPAARLTLMHALVGLAQTGMRCGELPAALAATERGIALAEHDPGLASQRVRARRLRGQVLDSMGRPDDALLALRQAIDDARSQPDGFAASILAISLIAMVLQRRGRHAESVVIAEEALAQCEGTEQIADPELHSGIGRLHTWLGHAASRSRQFARARAAYVEAQKAFRRAGDKMEVMAELSLGNVAYRAGDLSEAERVYRKVSAACTALDDVMGAATADTNLGNVLLDVGRHADALTALRASEKTQRRIGRLENLPETLRLIALALAAGHDRQGAQAAAHEALELAQQFGQTSAVAAVRETLTKLA